MRGIKESDLTDMSREELIEWLCWNDRNGIYRDEESIAEIGSIMTYEEAYWAVLKELN